MGGHALIIGGSLGGMFAAHLLSRSGWRVDVFERSAEDLAGRGAGLGTHEALIEVMRRIGIDGETALGVDTSRYILLDARGRIACQLEYPRVMTAWARLYRPLKDAFPAQHYHPAKSFVAAEQDEHGITAIFADGTRARGDLLVAADGPRSTVRPQVLPDLKPAYAGYIAWRGLTAEADVVTDRALLFESNTFCIPGGELAVSYPVPARDGDLRPGRRDYNIVWYRPTDAAALADLNTDASGRRHEQNSAAADPPRCHRRREGGRARAAGPVDRRYLRARRAADLSADPRLRLAATCVRADRVARRRGVRGAPHVGAGVTKAALDAACLADALVTNGTIEAALASYDRKRQRAGEWAVSRSGEFGACVSAEVSRSGMSAALQAERSERVFREYATLHHEVREWAKPSLRAAH